VGKGGRGGGYLDVVPGQRKLVVHVHHPLGEVREVPGVALDLAHGDALLGVVHQHLGEQVPQLGGHVAVLRDLVLQPQDPLQEHRVGFSFRQLVGRPVSSSFSMYCGETCAARRAGVAAWETCRLLRDLVLCGRRILCMATAWVESLRCYSWKKIVYNPLTCLGHPLAAPWGGGRGESNWP